MREEYGFLHGPHPSLPLEDITLFRWKIRVPPWHRSEVIAREHEPNHNHLCDVPGNSVLRVIAWNGLPQNHWCICVVLSSTQYLCQLQRECATCSTPELRSMYNEIVWLGWVPCPRLKWLHSEGLRRVKNWADSHQQAEPLSTPERLAREPHRTPERLAGEPHRTPERLAE